MSVLASIKHSITHQREFKTKTLQYMAKKYSLAGKDAKAIEVYKKAISIGDNDFRTFYSLGRLYLRTGDVLLAEKAAIQALIRNPSHRPSLRLMGNALAEKFPAHIVKNSHLGFFPSYVGEKYFSEELAQIDLAQCNSIERRKAFPAQSTILNSPKKIYEEAIEKFQLEKTDSPDRYIDIVTGGRLWYDDFNITVFDQDNKRIADHPVAIGYGPLISRVIRDRSPHKINGIAMLLGARNSDSFGHWILDALPAVEALRTCGIPLSSVDKFIISGSNLGFKKDTLEQLGIKEDRIFDISKNSFVSAEKMIIADVVTNMAVRMGSWVQDFYRREYLPLKASDSTSTATNSGKSKQGRRLYLSRSKSGTRSINNEKELISFLEVFGFEVTSLEEMSLKEQASLVAKAEIIIAPHGAALTNIMYCRPGTKIIELFSSHIEPCFWIMSQLFNLDYYNHFCKELAEDVVSAYPIQQRNAVAVDADSAYTVNVDEVLHLLELAGVTS